MRAAATGIGRGEEAADRGGARPVRGVVVDQAEAGGAVVRSV